MFDVTSKKSIFSRFRRNQDGNATIEFVLLFPVLMALFMTGFESGYYLVRGVMLERAVDVATRDVRLGNGKAPAYAALKKRVCEEAVIIPQCMKMVQVEIRPIKAKPGGVNEMSKGSRCVDADATNHINGTIYATGSGNQMMIVRVCALADPLFPTTGIGAGLDSDGKGHYAIIARSGFVNEPDKGSGRDGVGTYSVGNAGNGQGYGAGN